MKTERLIKSMPFWNASGPVFSKSCTGAEDVSTIRCFQPNESKQINRKHQAFPVGGWTNPSEKYARQIGFIFPNNRGETQKYLEPPASQAFPLIFVMQRWLDRTLPWKRKINKQGPCWLVDWIEVYHGKHEKTQQHNLKQSKTPVGLEATKEAMVAWEIRQSHGPCALPKGYSTMVIPQEGLMNEEKLWLILPGWYIKSCLTSYAGLWGNYHFIPWRTVMYMLHTYKWYPPNKPHPMSSYPP